VIGKEPWSERLSCSCICRSDEGNDVLLPLTTEFEGKKKYYFSQHGAIYLGTGMAHCVTCGMPSLCTPKISMMPKHIMVTDAKLHAYDS